MGGLLMGGGSHTYDKKIESLRVQSSSYGLPIPLVWGQTRIPGNIIDYVDFTAHEHTESTGGKGGGSEHTSYTYTVAVALALCEGSIKGLKRVWVDKECKDFADYDEFSLFKGEDNQARWAYNVSKHEDRALYYPRLAYIAGVYDLGDDSSLPNFTFEVQSGSSLNMQSVDSQGMPFTVVDANPKQVLEDFLTNEFYGAGFPSDYIGDWTEYETYCKANGIFISPFLLEQVEAQEFLEEICDATNARVLWSEGKLKMRVLGDEAVTKNGVTFTPDLQPVYDLTDDDFLVEGSDEDPVICSRNTTADAFNVIPVSFQNRTNNYTEEVIEIRDEADIEDKGLRPADTRELKFVCEPVTARVIGQVLLQRSLYIRNVYEFKLGWKYVLLEPMDIVTITDLDLGLDRTPVRILEIEENEEGTLTFKAEECPIGVAAACEYPVQSNQAVAIDYNAPPGNVFQPVFMAAPSELTVDGFETWIALNGGENWGGCDIWVSEDDETYKKIGRIAGKARRGKLTAALPTGAAVDQANTLSVALDTPSHQLLSGSLLDAENLNTLCYVDGEYMAYAQSTLTGAGRYDLDHLVRGVYGTDIRAHALNSSFVRVDDTLFKYPFKKDRIGKDIFLKFVSFNAYGSGWQNLSEVPSYQCKLNVIKPPKAKNIKLDEDTYRLADGTVFTDILLTFDMPTSTTIKHYNVYYERNGSGTWQFAGTTPDGEHRIKSIPQSTSVKVKVVAVNRWDISSDPAISTAYTIVGKNAKPSDVKEFNFEPVADGIVLTWQAVEDSDCAGYNIYRVPWGKQYGDPAMVRIAEKQSGTRLFVPMTEDSKLVFYIEAVDTSGNVSDVPTLCDVNVDLPPTPTGFDVIRTDSQVNFRWNPLVDVPNARYEVRRGESWKDGEILGKTENSFYSKFFPIPGDHTFWLKSIDQYGNYCAEPAFCTTRVAPLSDRNAIYVLDQVANAWAGPKVNMEIVGGALQLSDDADTGEHIVEIELSKNFMARNWIAFDYRAVPKNLPTWQSATWAWNSIEAQTPWMPSGNSSGIVVKHQIARYIGMPEHIIEAFSLDDVVTGQKGNTAALEAHKVTYQTSRFKNGAKVDDRTRIGWNVAVPATFSTAFIVKAEGGLPCSAVYMTLVGSAGKWLKIGYEKARNVFFAVDQAGKKLEVSPTMLNNDFILIGISQNATNRTLFAQAIIAKDAKQATAAHPTVGPFTQAYLYNK